MTQCKFDKDRKAPVWGDDYRNPQWCSCDTCSVELFGPFTIDKWGGRVFHGRKQ